MLYANKKYFVFFLSLILFIIGLSSFLKIPKESSPDVNIPFFILSLNTSGYDSITLYKEIVSDIEKKIKSTPGVNTVKSLTLDNFAVYSVEFNRGWDFERASSDLKNILDKYNVTYTINRQQLTNIPVYIFSSTSQIDEDELKKIRGIERVDVIGKPFKIISIDILYEKLIKHNIGLDYIYNKLLSYFQKRDFEFLKVKFNDNLNELYNIYILPNLTLGEIAKIYYENRKKNYAYIEGKEVYTYLIYKDSNSDIPSLISDIKNFLKDKEYYEIFSRNIEIENTFNTFLENFLQTSIIIFLVIFIFIGFKLAIPVFIVFPLVYLTVFIIFYYIGFTFNNIVSFSLVLSLGIIVDNLIVISEGYASFLAKGYNKIDALNLTLKTYRRPLVGGNLTTIAMFIPIYFGLSGRIGEFIKFLPITIILTLLVSFFIALYILPYFLYFFEVKSKESQNFVYIVFDKLLNFVLKFPLFFILFFWLVFIISLFVFIKYGKTDFLPAIDRDNIYINITYKDVDLAKNIEITNIIYEKIKNILNPYSGYVKYIQVNIGEKQTLDPLERYAYLNTYNKDIAKIDIKLVSSKERNIKSQDLVKLLQENLNIIHPNIKDISIFTLKVGPGGGKDITFYLIGDDIYELYKQYLKILPELKNINGTYGWDAFIDFEKSKLIYYLNNINFYQIDRNFLLYLQAIKSDDLLRSGIFLYSDKEKDFSYILYLLYTGDINNIFTNNMYLKNYFKENKIYPKIKFITSFNGQISLPVEAFKDPKLTLGEVKKNINKIVESNGIKISYGADLEDMARSGKDLGYSFIIGLLFMFLILLFQFGKLSYTLIIFSSLPLFLIGGFLFLLLFNLPFSFPAQLGIFGLIGVGINASILLIEAYNGNIKEAVLSRLRPVFLTTLTTVLGLVTLAIKDELWGSLAISFMGGLIIGTLIVLIYIPACLVYLKK